ncbi:hypothetical protein C8F04DRAFT_971901, partial [Mycena alexandri]
SNANLTFSPLPATGGSWKKSPVTMSWMPPKGLTSLRRMLPMRESLSNRSPSNIDTVPTLIKTEKRATITNLRR